MREDSGVSESSMVTKRFGVAVTLLLLLLGSTIGCDTGVATSPDPGVLRIQVLPDPSDNAIRLGPDRFTLSDSIGGEPIPTDLIVTFSQARLYRNDSAYVELSATPRNPRARQITLDVLRHASEPRRDEPFPVFEALLPPATYDSLLMRVRGRALRLASFENVVRPDPDAAPLERFGQEIRVRSDDTTTVLLQLRPFESLQRFRDILYFRPVLEIAEVGR